MTLPQTRLLPLKIFILDKVCSNCPLFLFMSWFKILSIVPSTNWLVLSKDQVNRQKLFLTPGWSLLVDWLPGKVKPIAIICNKWNYLSVKYLEYNSSLKSKVLFQAADNNHLIIVICGFVTCAASVQDQLH